LAAARLFTLYFSFTGYKETRMILRHRNLLPLFDPKAGRAADNALLSD
jgi:hypothetical protein